MSRMSSIRHSHRSKQFFDIVPGTDLVVQLVELLERKVRPFDGIVLAAG